MTGGSSALRRRRSRLSRCGLGRRRGRGLLGARRRRASGRSIGRGWRCRASGGRRARTSFVTLFARRSPGWCGVRRRWRGCTGGWRACRRTRASLTTLFTRQRRRRRCRCRGRSDVRLRGSCGRRRRMRRSCGRSRRRRWRSMRRRRRRGCRWMRRRRRWWRRCGVRRWRRRCCRMRRLRRRRRCRMRSLRRRRRCRMRSLWSWRRALGRRLSPLWRRALFVLLGFPSGLLRDHDRRALRMCFGACKLQRSESGRGKQHETKFCHDVVGPRRKEGSRGRRSTNSH